MRTQLETLAEDPRSWRVGDFPDLASVAAQVSASWKPTPLSQIRREQRDAFTTSDAEHVSDILLPHVATHRIVARLLFASAWHASPDFDEPTFILRMMDLLRLASAGQSGTSLMEKRVEQYERHLVYSSILAAAQRGLLSVEAIEHIREAFLLQDGETLTHDLRWIATEEAFSYDLLQDLCKPFNLLRKPTIKEAALGRRIKLFNLEGKPHIRGLLEQIRYEDPHMIVRDIREYCSQVIEVMRRDSPCTTPDVFRRLKSRYLNPHVFFAVFPFPADFAVEYRRSLQLERKRRLVHLIAKLEIYRMGHRQWPASLEFLAGDPIIDDVYTGGQVHYEATDRGVQLSVPACVAWGAPFLAVELPTRSGACD